MSGLKNISLILLIIGGLNWLLVGLFNWDVGQIFGGMDAVISKIIYILVGLAALYALVSYKKLAGGGGGHAASRPEPRGGNEGGGMPGEGGM